ncbi:MAG: hypothetical protein KME21_15065 [Desmonostoc vinosum HA7617-LM4]|jgi:hypothetical protein|nr:hypothetical protein [Desmonostoc vinosum HA7617-LM4]
MNAKIIAVLAIMTAFASLGSPVQAQSPDIPNQSSDNFKLTGDSLEGIDTKTVQDADDFAVFSNNNQRVNQTTGRFPLNQTISLPDTPILLQPAQSSESNDGVKVLVGSDE